MGLLPPLEFPSPTSEIIPVSSNSFVVAVHVVGLRFVILPISALDTGPYDRIVDKTVEIFKILVFLRLKPLLIELSSQSIEHYYECN